MTMLAVKTERSSSGISLTQATDYKSAEAVANSNGKVTGTVKAAFYLKFLEPLRGSAIFLHWKDAPTEKGWYLVNKGSHLYKRISDEEAAKPEFQKRPWHEKLYVYEGVLQAVREKRPLALYLGSKAGDGGILRLLDGRWISIPTKVVQVSPDHEAAAPPIAINHETNTIRHERRRASQHIRRWRR